MATTEITLAECPQVLQDRIASVKENLSKYMFEIISIQKTERPSPLDKTKTMFIYHVFVQCFYEVSIYKTTITEGGSIFDGEISTNIINAHEIEVIATKAKWIGDDLRRLLSENK